MRKARWSFLRGAMGCTLFAVLPFCVQAAPTFVATGPSGTIMSGLITEASGLVASRQNAGILWTHNDSALPGSLFALSTNGTVLARYGFPGVVSGDFEDLAVGPGPDPTRQYLYLGDIGDNLSARTSVRVFRCPEPIVYVGQTQPLQTFADPQTLTLNYPDGGHNAEAMLVDPFTGDLFIVTKSLTVAGLYRATAADLAAGGTVPLTLVRAIGFLRVSAADISPDGRLIALRSGNNAAVWSRAVRQSVNEALGNPAQVIPVMGEPAELNGETFAFDPRAGGYYTVSEGNSQPIFTFRRTDVGTPRPPSGLIKAGESWRYFDQGTDQGTEWRLPAFNDAAWPQGVAQLGYGQGDESTLVSFGANGATKHITTYFRRTFTAAAGDLNTRLVLRLCATDGAAVYLNGTEIVRRHLPADAPFNQLATANNASLENTWAWYPVNSALLVAGANTLAVELHRFSSSGATLSFDAQLVSGAFDHVPDGTDPGEPLDSILPRVAITAPAANLVVTNEVLTVRGTASDNIGLARVEWRLGSNPPQTVTGKTTWTAAVPLEVGTNIVTVVAYDFRTNASVPAVRQYIRRAVTPLTVEVSGMGTVTPNLNGLSLLVGNTYTVTATPVARHLFAGWNGGLVTNVARLSFVMQSNLLLRANFVTNPFYATKGVYRGLFEAPNTVSHEHSGALTITVTERGAFTAALRLAGRTASLSGQFDVLGHAERTVTAVGLGTLTLSMDMDLEYGTSLVTGQVAGASWTTPLLAYRAPVYVAANPSPLAGRYTMQIAGSTNEIGPLGHGVATLAVAASGVATLSGTLADGTKLAQAAPLSREGLWPLYLPLYAGRGSALGWLTLTNSPNLQLQGWMNWVRPSDPLARPIPAGFTNQTTVSGAGYSVAAATNFLNGLSNFCLTLRGLGPETQTSCLRRITRDTYAGEGFRTLKLDLPTGLWTGTFTNPTTRALLPVRFTALVPSGTGFGHILATNFSAAVELSPASPP